MEENENENLEPSNSSSLVNGKSLKSLKSSQSYNDVKNDVSDFSEDNDKGNFNGNLPKYIGENKRKIKKNYRKNMEDFVKFLEEETQEPDLMNMCKDIGKAEEVLKKCISLAENENWMKLKTDLENRDNILDTSYSTDLEVKIQMYVVYFYLGIANFRLQEYQQAYENFMRAMEIKEDYQIKYNIALCLIKLKKPSDALFYLNEVITENKYFYFGYYNLIKIYLKKGNYNDAFLVYREFSEVIKRQEKIESQNNRGRIDEKCGLFFHVLGLFYKVGAECLFSKQLYPECINTILEAMKYNENDPELWLLYAKVFIMKKNFFCAISLLKKALDLNEKYEEARKLMEFLEKNN